MSPKMSLYLFAFAGGVLLFSFEPLIGKLLLPAAGGAFQVWATALAFFQIGLLIGYLYAYWLAPRMGTWHLALLTLPLLSLPASGPGELSSSGGAVFWALCSHFGLPFLVLSTTAVVAQQWYAASRRADTGSPYLLYAWSNAGAVAGALSYAFISEPLLGLRMQSASWTGLYVVYVALGVVAWSKWRPARVGVVYTAQWRSLAIWAALAAAAAAYSVAVSNLLVRDFGHSPVVWVIPLLVYLATFAVAFAGRTPALTHRLWPLVAIVAIRSSLELVQLADIFLQLFALFIICLSAHGAIYDGRPNAPQLGGFYVAIAAGGAVGGAFSGLAAPLLFDGLSEYWIALIVLAAVQIRSLSGRGARFWLVATALALLSAAVHTRSQITGAEVVEQSRSPYGLYEVFDVLDKNPSFRALTSGTTIHGMQPLTNSSPSRQLAPAAVAYYDPSGPLGMLVKQVPSPRRVAVIGLGVGCISALMSPEDQLTYFELDPKVERLARQHFRYLREDDVVVIGDARQTLSRDDSAPYDLLIIDAFTGDSVPAHLLTVEAFALYRSRVRAGAPIVAHISNRYLDLRPVVAAAARAHGLPFAIGAGRGNGPLSAETTYACLSLPREVLTGSHWREPRASEFASVAPWTDDHASVLSLWLRSHLGSVF
jgi:hypothetical protein